MNKSWPILLLILIQVLFGINFITAKVVLKTISSEQFVFLRFLVSALGLLPFIVLSKLRVNITLALTIKSLLLGGIGLGFSQVLFQKGLHLTTATNTSLITSSIPIFTYILSILLKQSKLSLKTSFGISLGIIGILTLKDLSQFQLSTATNLGDFYVLGASVLFALYLNFSRFYFQKISPVVGSFLLFLCSTIVIAPFSNINLEIFPSFNDSSFYFSLAFSIIGATLLTYHLNNIVVTKVKSETISLFIFLQPIIASTLGVLFFNEIIGIKMLFSFILIFVGVLIVVKQDS